MATNCANCGISFAVEPEELQWISDNSGEAPTQCPRCRAFKAGLQDETITCTICNKVFIYPRELKLFARLFSWPRPRRCLGGCRRAAPEMTPEEKQMADFLKRIRANRRTASGPSMNFRKVAAPGATRLSKSDGTGESRGTPADVGGSLAEALKQFQARKRRRS